jgi:hypothetical protein
LTSGLDDAFALIAGRSSGGRPRVRARACLAGMGRKTGWSLAEHAREAAPDGMQRLSTTARWDQDAVCDDLRGHAVSTLGRPDGRWDTCRCLCWAW